MTETARRGDLAGRGDVARHQGDFRKIIEGFNGTLDAVTNPVNEAMEVMKVTAQNAANSEESASVAQELSSQARELQSMVKTFSLSRTPAHAPAHSEKAWIHNAGLALPAFDETHAPPDRFEKSWDPKRGNGRHSLPPENLQDF